MWTAEEIRYALIQFPRQRRISAADISKALSKRQEEIKSLRQRLAELQSLGGAGRPRRTTSVKRRKAKRSKRRLSAQARSRLRLQGRYMGYVRRLTAAQKAEVRKLREEKGWQAAIRMAARLLRRQTR